MYDDFTTNPNLTGRQDQNLQRKELSRERVLTNSLSKLCRCMWLMEWSVLIVERSMSQMLCSVLLAEIQSAWLRVLIVAQH
jgi:hypothetical protein